MSSVFFPTRKVETGRQTSYYDFPDVKEEIENQAVQGGERAPQFDDYMYMKVCGLLLLLIIAFLALNFHRWIYYDISALFCSPVGCHSGSLIVHKERMALLMDRIFSRTKHFHVGTWQCVVFNWWKEKKNCHFCHHCFRIWPVRFKNCCSCII